MSEFPFGSSLHAPSGNFQLFFFLSKLRGKEFFPELKDVGSDALVGGGRSWIRRTKELPWNGGLGRTTEDSKNWVQTFPILPHLPDSSWIWDVCGPLPGPWLPLNHPIIDWSPFSPASHVGSKFCCWSRGGENGGLGWVLQLGSGRNPSSLPFLSFPPWLISPPLRLHQKSTVEEKNFLGSTF